MAMVSGHWLTSIYQHLLIHLFTRTTPSKGADISIKLELDAICCLEILYILLVII